MHGREVKCMAFICHPTRPTAPDLLKILLGWASENGISALLSRRMAKRVNLPGLAGTTKEVAEKADIVVVLGGDGSILETVRRFAFAELPVVGINFGHLGFLTVADSSKALSVLERLKDGNFQIESRMMLEASVKRNGNTVFTGIALNDVVLIKGPVLRVIDVSVAISGTYINSFKGDGIIFSSPTGSTAYSLSAGGPIVPPWVGAIIVCPLNTHTLNARPVITSDSEVIQARLKCTHSQVSLVLDGQESFGLENEDEIEVRKSQAIGRIVVFRTRNFFRVLRKKMNWG